MDTSTDRGMTEQQGGGSGGSNMQQELEALRNGFNKLRTDVVELFNHAMGLGRTGADQARDYGTDTIEQLKDRFNDLRTRGADQMATFEHRIEEKPLQSAMIAFGVGFIVAKLMHRRH